MFFIERYVNMEIIKTVKQARKQKPGTDYNLYDCIVALVKIVQNLHTYI